MQIELKAEKILIANKAIDFRKSLDGLNACIVEELELEPHEGIYIFYNKSLNRIKILGWHKNGFVMVYKRLERGKFFVSCDEDNLQINAEQLTWLLSGVNWQLLSQVECKYNTYI
jgi:transposase